ncbi:hypothetical protein KIPB_017338, partial [Kipferlia bialata]|eukprot:g17338.t1
MEGQERQDSMARRARIWTLNCHIE